MVLVSTKVPVRPKAQSDSNTVAESSSAQAPLPRCAPESSFYLESRPSVDSTRAIETQNGPKPYQTQLRLLEQQNIKRLLLARQDMAEEQQRQDNEKRTQESMDLSSTSREGYHIQQMVWEQESGKTLIGARQQLAGQIPGASDSRNQGHDTQATVGIYQDQGLSSDMEDAMLAIVNERRLEKCDMHAAGRDPKVRQRDQCCEHDDRMTSGDERVAAERKVFRTSVNRELDDYELQLILLEQQNRERLMLRRMQEEAAKQSTASQPASRTQAEDKWGKCPFPAGQGVISGYQVQLMAIENRCKEETAARSQTEVEFSEQPRRYLTEETEMSIMSGQELPGAPGSSCAPPSTHLAFRSVPRPDAAFDDLYDH